jgi:hypothetical protein
VNRNIRPRSEPSRRQARRATCRFSWTATTCAG